MQMDPVNEFLTDSFVLLGDILHIILLIVLLVICIIIMIWAILDGEWVAFFTFFALSVGIFLIVLWVLSFIYDF